VMLLADNRRLAQNLVPALYGFSHLSWFLAFLFLYYLIAYATRNKGWWLVAGVSYGLSILLFVTGSPLDRGFVNLWDVPYYFLYFVAGCRFVQSPEAVALFHQDRVILAGWLAGIAVIAVAVVISPPNTFPGYLPVVLASLPFWFWMASARPLQAPLAYVGRNAIYFFVLHYPIIILGKRFLRPPVVASISSALLLPIVLAVGIPALTAYLARRSSVVRAFFVRPECLRGRALGEAAGIPQRAVGGATTIREQ
jgi:hypothetical protein